MVKYKRNRKCPKCGECDTNDNYHAKGENIGYPTFGEYLKAVITRCCKVCRYEWNEKPLDSK